MPRLRKNKLLVNKETAQPFIESYGEYLPLLKRRKTALLSYLTGPVIDELQGDKLVRFSNHGLGVSWARALNELGYSVDIIDWDNNTYIPNKNYDLIVFHGGKNFHHIMKHVQNKPKIIHWLTGSYWKFNNSEEDARLEDFAKRHKVHVDRDRYIHASEDEVNETADGIIVLGDPSMRDTFPKEYKKVLTVNNGSYPDSHFDGIKKDYQAARNNFLFFAGGGNVHKGLDLLIDAFQELDQHLYIVASTDKKVLTALKNELKRPNIHLFGEVGMRTEPFYDAMDRCAYAILPSCSEGQAGSVVEAMNQGLIPIVSKETRLDASGYGHVLKSCSIGDIRKAVKTYAGLPPAEVSRLSHMTRKVAVSQHSPAVFREQLIEAIKAIL